MKIQIKRGNYNVTSPSTLGFSFDNWVFQSLENYGLSPNRLCCGDNHLMFQSGIISKKVFNFKSKDLYNMEKWLKKSLLKLGVINSTVANNCCIKKPTLFIQKDRLYFGDKILGNNADLFKRLKFLLDSFSINYIDACCP